MTSTGTTTAAQSALSQRILDPFSRGFQAVAKKIPAPGACIPLTASSLFGPLAGAQRLDVGSVVELPTGRPAGGRQIDGSSGRPWFTRELGRTSPAIDLSTRHWPRALALDPF